MTEHNVRAKPEAVWPGLEAGVPKPVMPYSPAIKAGGWVFIAGQLASDFKTGIAPEAIPGNPYLEDGLQLQSRYVLNNLASTIEATGCDISRDTARIWEWFVSPDPTPAAFERGDNWTGISIDSYLNARASILDGTCPPTSSLGVAELMWLGTKVEVDMICFDDDDESVFYGLPEDQQSTSTGHAPALRHGDWVFLAAESAVDWIGDSLSPVHLGEPTAIADQARGNPNYWIGEPVERQTDYVLEKLAGIAAVAGTSLENTVKAEVYIGHPRDFSAMDRAWRRWFPENPPARVVTPNMGMGGRGCRVEIALTLLADDAKQKKQTIETSQAPEPLGHEAQAIKAGNFLFFSTQMAFDSAGKLADGMSRHPNNRWYGSPGQAQMRYMMKNVAAICEEAGTSVENICRRVCLHSDLQWFAESIEEWARYFPGDRPASTTIGLHGPFVVPGANTLLDLIAYIPD
ncbi:MAG: RidA family protein [Gammaproteobacteria bacterium]|nr:hypothetical protein [Chromatiales bacterium]MCP4924918.1 RidA family protein [Gammaproteobacteria bacterium]